MGRPRGSWSNKRGQGEAARFLRDHVSYDGPDCLLWPFSKNPNGYGMMGFEGRTYWAHRFMCTLVHGDPPSPDHEAAHSCGRGHDGCVHPMHLSWKTISENLLDCRQHGTQARSFRGNRGRLSDEEVQEIKGLKDYLTQVEIAAMFGVSPPTVRDVLSGRSRGNRKLRKPFTDAEVFQIRHGADSPKDLAKRFKTGLATIWRVRSGKTYRDVTAKPNITCGQEQVSSETPSARS